MRRLGRLGVWYPIDRLDGAGLRRLLGKVEELGFSTFWYPEALGYELLSIASFMLANTSRLIIGSSIANIYARDPFTARRGLRTLSSLYEDRFILGLGVSHAPMVERRGHVYDKPVPTMRRYLDGVYEKPSDAAEWPLMIAALGPLMLKLAAERTAGALPYNVTPEHTREARAALGPDKLLAVEQKVCLETDAADGARSRPARTAPLYGHDQLPQQLAADRLHRSRSRRWRFRQVPRCDGALGRCGDDCAGLKGAFRRWRKSRLHSAGPRGRRHGSAGPNPGGARERLTQSKLSAYRGRPRCGPHQIVGRQTSGTKR